MDIICERETSEIFDKSVSASQLEGQRHSEPPHGKMRQQQKKIAAVWQRRGSAMEGARYFLFEARSDLCGRGESGARAYEERETAPFFVPDCLLSNVCIYMRM